ncbi:MULTISPECIES: endolytic transglycosylase MltG [unclassified Streptomyces]|uniref:endolytic transglycosylase MltG n=1 Tax=unclassified Streptomyces TaxID=2593676 RepID=UPI000F6FC894|nr:MULTISPECIES: endolytic transglycosylase MltG [unclassified Streptomyces]AZM63339.1 endolytic transglycosylase MltG [Streptomyces sp. WAC 01438]RSN00785.1 endolytic transglycosylase MltG [Streptomyces sp. WAC 01420]
MTEYGRGPGSEPWHPDDPLYGDGGWGGQQVQQGQQPPYGGQPQHYPQQPQTQQQYGDWGTGEQHGYGHQQYPQYDQYGQQYAPHPQQQPQYDQNGWPTGTYPQDPYAAGPQDPYAVGPTDPYLQQTGPYGGQPADHYGTPDAYPPPEPPGRRRAEPEPEPETDWDPGPDQGEHAFFAGGDDDDGRDDDPDDRRGRGERRGGKEKKRRSGLACLVVVVVFGGGLAGVGYFGYQFYQDRFGSPADFAGSGNGEQVTVTIPKGSGGYAIGQALKKQGVVKSVDAFVAAQASHPQGKSIQDGVYTLQKEMSAASAVELMLSPKSRNNLIIAEGKRNADVYQLVDKRLGVKKGTTAKVAETKWKSLGLPDWAVNHENVKDPLEGFLFPSSYAVAKGQKPEDVLRQMVARATEKYEGLGFESKAESLGLEGPWELVTVASLVQAEGKTHEDFRKMSEVVYNRLKTSNTETNQELQFDSTFNYLLGQSKIDISESEINSNPDPYNTYTNKGLPPGPIGNPGEEALQAALNPTSDGWMYFVATDGMNKTEFAKTIEEHQKLVDKFNASRGN